ncbi:MAG: hypothetical protein OES47_05140 [Acidobacteriota bacterium]|nr:hypothetical protein [Acidobacteriota bacterium]
MDRFAGKTVANKTEGYALIEERRNNCPQVGDDSPDFELEAHNQTRVLRLSSLWAVRPVVLIFASLT